MRIAIVACVALSLCACERRGNLRSAADFHPPPAPEVKNPWYDPYAAYGEANARWRPPVFDRRGTIVRPGGGDVLLPSGARPPGVF